jgi:putative lipoprotein
MTNLHFIRLSAFVTLFLSTATFSIPTLMTASAGGAKQSKPGSQVHSEGASRAVEGLFGTRWRLTELRGNAVNTTRAYVVFNRDTMRYSGEGGCNSFSGSFKISAMNLKLSPAVHTLMACLDNGAQQVEDNFLKGLEQSTGFQIHDDILHLSADGLPILSFKAEATVTGTVTYLQRIALTPGAVIEVKLVDVSRPDAPATISEQTIRTVGQQVPIAFVLPYDPRRIEHHGRYVVRARILEDGKLLFINEKDYPVITDWHRDTVTVIVKQASR